MFSVLVQFSSPGFFPASHTSLHSIQWPCIPPELFISSGPGRGRRASVSFALLTSQQVHERFRFSVQNFISSGPGRGRRASVSFALLTSQQLHERFRFSGLRFGELGWRQPSGPLRRFSSAAEEEDQDWVTIVRSDDFELQEEAKKKKKKRKAYK